MLANSNFGFVFVVVLASTQALTVFKLRNSDATRDFTVGSANDAQNCCRALHGAAPLELDSNITAVAQNWADYLASIDDLEHSDTDYGENLFAGSLSTVDDGEVPIYYWYNESYGYDYTINSAQNAGHFTQMVWQATQLVGFGIASSSDWTYVVANYDPPGNSGDYIDNVLPPNGTNNCFDDLDIQALDLAFDFVQIM